MDVKIENHRLIEAAFYAYDLSKGSYVYNKRNSNEDKAIVLAIYLLVEYNSLTFIEIGEIFNMDCVQVAFLHYKLQYKFNDRRIQAKNTHVLKRYKKAKYFLNHITQLCVGNIARNN